MLEATTYTTAFLAVNPEPQILYPYPFHFIVHFLFHLILDYSTYLGP